MVLHKCSKTDQQIPEILSEPTKIQYSNVLQGQKEEELESISQKCSNGEQWIPDVCSELTKIQQHSNEQQQFELQAQTEEEEEEEHKSKTRQNCSNRDQKQIPEVTSEPTNTQQHSNEQQQQQQQFELQSSIPVGEIRKKNINSDEKSLQAEVSGREKLKRHRMEVAGRVWIPDLWGQEELLKDWIDCSAFDKSLFPNAIVSARAALIGKKTIEDISRR